MLKIFDKAQWHIDAGEDPTNVILKMKAVLLFLNSKGMLASEGQEILDLGVDSSVSIHERMVTEEGKKFMEACYDNVINKNADQISGALDKEYRTLYHHSSLVYPSGLSNASPYVKNNTF